MTYKKAARGEYQIVDVNLDGTLWIMFFLGLRDDVNPVSRNIVDNNLALVKHYHFVLISPFV